MKMKINLYMQGHFILSSDILFPENSELSFQEAVSMREEFREKCKEAFVVKYKLRERKDWDLVLTAESKVGEIIKREIRKKRYLFFSN